MMKKFGIGIALGVVGAVLLTIIGWVSVVYTGVYNVAASDPHADPVRWSLDTTMHRSVARQAGGIDIPANPSRALLAEGAGHYAESCVHCHGAPGQQPSKWSRGMRPRPPHLMEAARKWSPEEVHWIVSNGIKMTGMPAFGAHHTAEEILALTAFVSALPGLGADDYRALTGSDQQDHQHLPPSAADDANAVSKAKAPAQH